MGWIEWFFVFTGAFITYGIGLLGGAQIYGSLEYRRVRPVPLTVFTIALWSAVLAGGVWAILNWFPQYKVFLLLAMGIGFCLSLRHQEI